MIEEHKQLHRRVRALEEIATRVEAEELLARATTSPDNLRMVNEVFDNREPESLKQLALSLISHSATIALLGSRDKDAARLVFARSGDAPGDMNALMRDACTLLDGRGGGKPDLAQGGGKNVTRLDEAIAQAAERLNSFFMT
jgi:alanyl-tRNA synthetase